MYNRGLSFQGTAVWPRFWIFNCTAKKWISILESVRIAYNEDSNVIVTVTGSASQLRASGLFYRQLFPGYRPVGLSRNSACLKIINGQKQIKLSENSMGS